MGHAADIQAGYITGLGAHFYLAPSMHFKRPFWFIKPKSVGFYSIGTPVPIEQTTRKPLQAFFPLAGNLVTYPFKTAEAFITVAAVEGFLWHEAAAPWQLAVAYFATSYLCAAGRVLLNHITRKTDAGYARHVESFNNRKNGEFLRKKGSEFDKIRSRMEELAM